jgi:hypothetical protein
MTDTVTEAKLGGKRIPGNAEQASSWTSPWSKTIRWIARTDACDIATVALIAALVGIALLTFKDYAISNDEGIQHRYGELIIAYYASGFADQGVFNFQNLYLYGGLFDIAAVLLSHLVPIDPYDLRHILCALIGIGGIGAAAATARLIAGPRAALIAAVGLSVSGAWYGTMFNHTKDIPFAAAMIGATLFLIRIARSLPSPRAGDIAAFGVLAGAALGMRVLGLLLVVYIGFAIVLYLPRLSLSYHARWRFAVESSVRLLPAMLLAYVIMILAWPWAALAPLNPIRGLLAFSEYQYHGPAFTGLRHFLFVIPALAVLAGIGLDAAVTALATRGRLVASAGLAVVTACFLWNAVTLVRLHPYEYLFYNAAVGGLEGASRRYDLDYWFNSMPEALNQLEAYLRRTEPGNAILPTRIYSVAVCGERLSFEKTVTLPQLHWDFKHQWNESEFFIAPTHMNCDGDVDGKVIGTVERLGVVIAYVKDRRALTHPVATAAQ